ncbi:uncharacterized protein N7515_007160 [Penicillium bovifimosum]|uniref:Non-structural maintenance of chromosomes element 1 homolog n=1 Tax=Penicillium bovifimosum TaxID=126998 RepID=A0A9W9L1E3_9EURO|nr:uncharacterized protein N7515_007160 [Penicillium bovifimosum]KAJ5131121.1 hypothetical protein N7515_007160 [Penicillium bovifimosum]
MSEYNDSNRAFLQAFMARSAMTFAEAQPILAAIFTASSGRTVDPGEVTEEEFARFVAAANTAVSPFDLEIRSSLPQATQPAGQDASTTPPARIYALVNTTSDPLTQLATTYSPDEISFLKRLLDYMFIQNNTRRCEGMALSQMQAVQLHKAPSGARQSIGDGSTQTQTQTASVQSLRMTQAETMIIHLMEEGWLQKSPKGYLSLMPRALMELRGWLVSTYNEDNDGTARNRIKFCSACKDIITVGQRCSDLECYGRLHNHCMRNFFRMQQAEECPVCGKEWPGDMFVGEKALAANARPRNAPRQSQAAHATPSDAGEEPEDENDDEE